MSSVKDLNLTLNTGAEGIRYVTRDISRKQVVVMVYDICGCKYQQCGWRCMFM